MAGKIRYIIALFAVLGLIYVQQSSVTYAGEGYPDRGEAAEEEKLPEEGGEEKPPEGGEEKPPEGGEEKPPEGGEEKPPEEDKQPVKEDKKIEGYKIEIPKPNGERGYYTNKPEIMISHVSEAGATKYCFKNSDNRQKEEILEKKGEKAVITGKMFSEGKNTLYVWMEDEKGEKIEKYELKKEFLIDTKEPEIQMSVPEGFDTWYQEKVMLSVAGEDSGSGIVKLSCKEGGRSLGSIGNRQGEFMISQPSISGKGVEVTVTAEDKAGNKCERIKTVYIDKTAPEVAITGAENYMITGKSVNLAFEISEENMLQEFYARTVWTNVKGKEKQLSSSEWKNNSKGKVLAQTLKNDGVYHMKIQARDMSGHISTKNMQVIIDKTNPVISYIEALDGKQLKKFKWEYPIHQMIRDFTTYIYEMRIDGQLYHMGESVNAEGKHRMTVKATDAAGNTARASADFIVDHTAPEIIFRNIEGGKEYEEERTFHVELAKEEDMIRQVQINGEDQRIDPHEKSYECTLNECKDYEVTVKASDFAGNESVETLFFKLVPQKTLVEKITEPIKIQWGMGKKAKMQFPGTIGQDRRQNSSMSVLTKVIETAFMIGSVTVPGVLYYKKVRKKETAEK